MATPTPLSADESAVYDRQLRLWGFKAQEHIRRANVLLISMRALANEVAKNLVLTGINSLTIVDPEPVTGEDLGAQFFLTEDDIGKNRAEAAKPRVQALNNRVAIHTSPRDPRTLDAAYMQQFTHIIATDLPYPTFAALNAAARAAGRPFYAAAAHGAFGFIFADLLEHEFVVERASPNRGRTAAGPQQGRRETATRRVVDVQQVQEDAPPQPEADKAGRRGTTNVVERVRKREAYSEMSRGAGAKDVKLPPAVMAAARRRRQVSPLLACVRALWELEAQAEAEAAPPPPPPPPEDGSSSHSPSPSASSLSSLASAVAQRLRAGDAADVKAFAALASRAHAALGLPAETLKADLVGRFARGVGVELGPAVAMLGGLLAQDAINVIGGRQQPVQNLCLFDGEAYQVPVYALHPVEVYEGEANGNGTAEAVVVVL